MFFCVWVNIGATENASEFCVGPAIGWARQGAGAVRPEQLLVNMCGTGFGYSELTP